MTSLLRHERSVALARLAGPLALTQLAQVALTTTDTIMMGSLSAEALAAGGLAIVVFNLVRTMGVGLITALGNQVAAAAARQENDENEANGEDRETADARAEDEVRDLVRAGLVVATLAGLLGAGVMVALGCALVWLGQEPALVDRSRAMLLALAPGLLPCLWFQAVRQYTVGMQRPQALVRITLASIAANAGLNWVLLTGWWIFPELGLTGLGLSTSCVYLLSFVALFGSTRRDPEVGGILASVALPERPSTIGRLLRLGIPISATYGSEAGFFFVVALLMGTFGTAALAAHTAVNQLVYIVFQVTIGISHAASVLVSRELAGRHVGAARRLGHTALVHGTVVMSVVALVYLARPEQVLRLFFDPGVPEDAAALAIATHLLFVAAALQYVDCAQNIGVGLLRGAHDTAGGFKVTLVGYWLVGLPAALVLTSAVGAGPVGVWLGLMVGLATTAVLLLRRFARKLADLAAAARPEPLVR